MEGKIGAVKGNKDLMENTETRRYIVVWQYSGNRPLETPTKNWG